MLSCFAATGLAQRQDSDADTVLTADLLERASALQQGADVAAAEPARRKAGRGGGRRGGGKDRRGGGGKDQRHGGQDGKPTHNVVLAVEVAMEDSYDRHCPEKQTEVDPLRTWVTDTIADKLRKQHIDAKIKSGLFKCECDNFHNTTITFILSVSAKCDKKHLEKVVHELEDEELCDLYGIDCEDHSVWSFVVERRQKLPAGLKLRPTKPDGEGRKDGGGQRKRDGGDDGPRYKEQKDGDGYQRTYAEVDTAAVPSTDAASQAGDGVAGSTGEPAGQPGAPVEEAQPVELPRSARRLLAGFL